PPPEPLLAEARPLAEEAGVERVSLTAAADQQRLDAGPLVRPAPRVEAPAKAPVGRLRGGRSVGAGALLLGDQPPGRLVAALPQRLQMLREHRHLHVPVVDLAEQVLEL